MNLLKSGRFWLIVGVASVLTLSIVLGTLHRDSPVADSSIPASTPAASSTVVIGGPSASSATLPSSSTPTAGSTQAGDDGAGDVPLGPSPSGIDTSNTDTGQDGTYSSTAPAKAEWEPRLIGFGTQFGIRDATWSTRVGQYVTPSIAASLKSVDITKVRVGAYKTYTVLKYGDEDLVVKITYEEGWSILASLINDPVGGKWDVYAYDLAT